ncbi:hypothetical protein [Terricaulis sp.]|uniref:hypothetical protein n=1 Tax=Terricaulis sp. TaxID=2768686 RepID=UPI0037835F10
MSVFEFVLALTSVISGLALAHMLTGVVGLLRNAQRVRFSLVHALWMWSAFSTTIGNWAADWSLRTVTEWPAWMLLLIIASKIAQYVFCVFVTPDLPTEGKIDLVAFHASERRGYFGAVFAFTAVALVFNIAFGAAEAYAHWLRDSAITLIAIAVTLLAFFVRAYWAQLLAAAVFAALGSYFLLAAASLGAA